jgi:hypothetical protein
MGLVMSKRPYSTDGKPKALVVTKRRKLRGSYFSEEILMDGSQKTRDLGPLIYTCRGGKAFYSTIAGPSIQEA